MKRAQLEDERLVTIEHENRLLLEKMSKIMSRQMGPYDYGLEFVPGLRIDRNHYPSTDHYISARTNLAGQAVEPHSLNNQYRRRQLETITMQNAVSILPGCSHAHSHATHLLCMSMGTHADLCIVLQALVQRVQNREPNYNTREILSSQSWLSNTRSAAQNDTYRSNIFMKNTTPTQFPASARPKTAAAGKARFGTSKSQTSASQRPLTAAGSERAAVSRGQNQANRGSKDAEAVRPDFRSPSVLGHLEDIEPTEQAAEEEVSALTFAIKAEPGTYTVTAEQDQLRLPSPQFFERSAEGYVTEGGTSVFASDSAAEVDTVDVHISR